MDLVGTEVSEKVIDLPQRLRYEVNSESVDEREMLSRVEVMKRQSTLAEGGAELGPCRQGHDSGDSQA